MTKVAVVEDDAQIREILERAMLHAGYQVMSAGDGKRGLDIILREQPKVAILDVMMPGMSGYAVCHAVKQLMGPRAPYIIMLTARGQPTDVAAGHAHGADLYLIKPVDLSKLISHVREALGEGQAFGQSA